MPDALRNVLLIARREYLERVRAQSFKVMTVLIPLLMGGMLFGIFVLNRAPARAAHLAVLTANAAFAQDFRAEMSGGANAADRPVVDVRSPDEANVRAALDAQMKSRTDRLDGYLVAEFAAENARPALTWVPRAAGDSVTRGRVAQAARAALVREQLMRSGTSPAAVAALLEPVTLKEPATGARADSRGALASAYGMYFLMYFVILFYGMNVARSIIEEKTSRVFEVLLATVRPGQMLAGKVMGVGAVGLTQIGIWIAVTVLAVKLHLLADQLPSLPSAPEAGLFVLFFVLGYTLYSSIAAALGAMTNSEQELQQMQFFMMMPLMASFLVIYNVTTNPDGAIAQAFSLFPFTAPLIMYTRVIVGKPGALAVLASVAGLAITIAIVLWLASRIYRVGILMYGKKPNLAEILRWLRYS